MGFAFEFSCAIGILNMIIAFIYLMMGMSSNREESSEMIFFIIITGGMAILDFICLIIALCTRGSVFLSTIGVVLWTMFFLIEWLEKKSSNSK